VAMAAMAALSRARVAWWFLRTQRRSGSGGRADLVQVEGDPLLAAQTGRPQQVDDRPVTGGTGA